MLNRLFRALKNKNTRELLLRRAKSLVAIRMRDFLSPHPAELAMLDYRIGEGRPVFIIAEIGVNHNGSIELAKKLIDAAKESGVDAVKFQKRHLEAAYQKEVVDHPERFEQAFQYLIPLLKEFEFGEAEYRELARYAKEKGILFLATPFDEPSVEFLARLELPLYKVGSCDLVNLPLLERLCEKRTPLILSTGMSNLAEIDETVAFLRKKSVRFALLHCQSTYPAPIDTLNLSMIPKLKERYRVPIGYSGHELGIYHTFAAVVLGASIIERHITLDRTLPGPDHPASLEPDEFKELVQRIREYEIARGVPVKRISRGEAANHLTLRKSIVAALDIPKGTKIVRGMLTAKSPGTGLSPQRLYDLVGKRASRHFRKDEMFVEADLYPPTAPPQRLPRLSSKWGLKARFFELDKLSKFEPQPAFFEFHMSDKDLDFEFDTARKYSQELYIHAPEYWQRQIIDLASLDDEVWEQSIRVMQQTIDKVRHISASFRGTPKIIIHVGGMSVTPIRDHARLLQRAEEAFRRLDAKGVEILPENLPPFGWFFSGLWHCNIFGDVEEMIGFCKRLGYRMCLDLSHAWLYSTHHGLDYLEYIRKAAPYTAHLHIADGRGSHKEGLQIGSGDVPFEKAFAVLSEALPVGQEVSWLPEIWQGHVDNYREFKIALDKLARYPFLYQSLRGRAPSEKL